MATLASLRTDLKRPRSAPLVAAPTGVKPNVSTVMPKPSITPTTPQQTMLGAATQAAKPNVAPVRPMIQPTAPPTDTGPITDFGPGNDLRSSQINPLASNRLQQTQSVVDAARGQIGQGPTLSDAARREFDLLGQQSAEQRQLGIRNIGQAAARLGRIGSGMVTTDLGNLEDVLRTREEQARSGLAADVARGEASDRRANLGALSGLEGQLFGQEAGQRGELRTERGYQTDSANQATDRRIQQRLLEEQLLNSGFNRELAGAELGLQGSDLYGQDAAASSDVTAELLAELGRQAAARRRTGAGSPVSDASYAGAGYS